MNIHLFKGTGKLTGLLLRQQRFKILIWLLGLILITLSVATAYPDMYTDEKSKQAFSLTMDNPAMVAMLGSGYEGQDYLNSIGTLFAHEMLLFTAIAVAIMSILLVGRSTRADEEDGRTEMIHALPVGRLSYVSAAIIILIAVNVVLTLLIGLGLSVLGIEGINPESSFLYGAILGATGLVFGGFTAIFAQLAETSRGTTMLSFAVLIVAYLIRAVGDVSNESISLFSPLGWTVRTDVFAEDDWWSVFLSLVLSGVIIIIVFYLKSIRDLGSGFIPARGGRKYASSFLQTPIGLTLRLQLTNIISWGIGLFALGAAFGSILGDLETYFADIEFMQAFLTEEQGYTMTEQFIVLLMAIMSLIGTIPAVMTVLKLKGEENKNRTEYLYSRALSRTRLLGGYFLLAIVVSIMMQLLTAIGLWSAAATVMEEGLTLGTIFKSAFIYLPAMWVVVGLAVLMIGLIPKATGFVWFYVVYGFVVIYLNGILDFPEWVNNLSVYEHIPQIPVEEMDFMKITVLIIIAVILTFAGFLGYNRRDIEG
ncbi:ABC transporter permease [Virgibacillus profundi]|uniref:ABC transporter permease n=1 Tax=Virgibacillus profundi TaxID=2024555 RepID=A0A2A2IAE3_9BACI|nr:ABC-2 transporter permease [Virgibacillus profundi]PAV28254.1 ABC transporter permease [Virgibacillus profundi]PXY52558.1 ABC transporter permease [Virgibacillus profundi]